MDEQTQVALVGVFFAVAAAAFSVGYELGRRAVFKRWVALETASGGLLGTSEPVGPSEGPLPPPGLYAVPPLTPQQRAMLDQTTADASSYDPGAPRHLGGYGTDHG